MIKSEESTVNACLRMAWRVWQSLYFFTSVLDSPWEKELWEQRNIGSRPDGKAMIYRK